MFPQNSCCGECAPALPPATNSQQLGVRLAVRMARASGRWTMRSSGYLGGFAMIFAAMSASASSDNPFGFYAGVAAGRSDIRIIGPYSGLDRDARPTGWAIFTGLRPISLIGAELEYVDYGHSTVQSAFVLPDTGPHLETVDWHQRATTLSGLIFAPIPLPFLDIYGRAGLAQVETKGSAAEEAGCRSSGNYPSNMCATLDQTATHFSYGAGAQLKISSLAFRLEYQRIGAIRREPELLSLGLSWTF